MPLTYIRRCVPADAGLLSPMGWRALMESHGHSASAEDIRHYLDNQMSPEAFLRELSDPNNIFHVLLEDELPAGYTKIIYNASHPNLDSLRVTKLERIYLTKEFYGKGYGDMLLDHVIDICREQQQAGVWLNVWVENHRAIAFYKKRGFVIFDRYDFVVSPTHTNPNHQMYLALS